MRIEKGFTLIELMITVAIIAILAGLSIVAYGLQLKKSRDTSALQVLTAIRGGIHVAMSDNTENAYVYPRTIQDIRIYLSGTLVQKVQDGINSSGPGIIVTSFQISAGRVEKNGVSTVGNKGKLLGTRDVAEIYYYNTDGTAHIDGIDNDIDYLDTKGKLWKYY